MPAASLAGVAEALEPPDSGGVAALDRALVELSGNRRLLVVGAHPDDEDNALLSFASRGLGAEVAYLSLSRGEGGQNLIGTELGADLGVLRTGELLSARTREGGRQFFTRAFDFGYTRSLDETFERWPRLELQKDAIRVARRFMPQVVVSVFPASERARHGQHQASAVIARDLFDLSGDAGTFPELADEGLEPWAPERLFRRSWGLQEATLTYDVGGLDPVSGRSWMQLAADSRSQHRSQDMGRVQPIGNYRGGLVWIAGGAGSGGQAVFEGIDTSLAGIAAPLSDGAIRAELQNLLAEVERLARRTRKNLVPSEPGSAVEACAEIVRLLARAAELAQEGGSSAVGELIDEKREAAAVALAAAAQVVVDARSDSETIAGGGGATLELEVWSPRAEIEVEGVSIVSRPGWSASTAVESDEPDTESGVRRWLASASVSPGAGWSMPYFSRRPREGDLYSWDGVAAGSLGAPFAPPPLVARFDLEVAGAKMQLEREVVHRYGDQAIGEIRRPLRAVPAVELEVSSSSALWIVGETKSIDFEVVVRSNLDDPVAGLLDCSVSAGWAVSGEKRFEIDLGRGSSVSVLKLVPQEAPDTARVELQVTATAAGEAVTLALPVLDYPHVRPRAVPRPATLEVSVLDLDLPRLTEVGYVRGASDRVPSVLAALGMPLTVLNADELRIGDLDRFDVIVIGSRAYEIDSALRNANPRLLAYVERGGTLLVQYQQYQFVQGGFAPFNLEIARPHGRVTDETAPVRLLEEEHSLLTYPNTIEAADWDGWVQERGLYFPSLWDESFTPLLAMNDAGRDEERGALLIAGYGRGTYIYSGLSFFRQLPAGVPGAIRLFANLLAAGEEETP